ncbi:hypothetical protein EDC01DRAFT_778753 [Geopyxis carbonaria]|nr:hypothetical protein EDC01DRAFT_778753 [Geopyxis carbonaria]
MSGDTYYEINYIVKSDPNTPANSSSKRHRNPDDVFKDLNLPFNSHATPGAAHPHSRPMSTRSPTHNHRNPYKPHNPPKPPEPPKIHTTRATQRDLNAMASAMRKQSRRHNPGHVTEPNISKRRHEHPQGIEIGSETCREDSDGEVIFTPPASPEPQESQTALRLRETQKTLRETQKTLHETLQETQRALSKLQKTRKNTFEGLIDEDGSLVLLLTIEGGEVVTIKSDKAAMSPGVWEKVTRSLGLEGFIKRGGKEAAEVAPPGTEKDLRKDTQHCVCGNHNYTDCI